MGWAFNNFKQLFALMSVLQVFQLHFLSKFQTVNFFDMFRHVRSVVVVSCHVQTCTFSLVAC